MILISWILHVTACGEHDNRYRVVGLTQLREHLEAALAGEHDVQDHQIEVTVGRLEGALLAVAAHHYPEALFLEPAADKLRDLGLVFD